MATIDQKYPALIARREEADIVSQARLYLSQLLLHSHVYAHIESTNACNAECSVCPRGAMHRTKIMMPWPTFLALCDVILPSPIPMISFVGFGEPTLHKRLSDMIGYVRDRRPEMILKVTSNGALLGHESVARLFDHGLDYLEISVMGASSDEYEQMMDGLAFQDIVELIGILNSLGVDYSITSFPFPGRTSQEIADFWLGLGAVDIQIKGLHRRGGYLGSPQLSGEDAQVPATNCICFST